MNQFEINDIFPGDVLTNEHGQVQSVVIAKRLVHDQEYLKFEMAQIAGNRYNEDRLTVELKLAKLVEVNKAPGLWIKKIFTIECKNDAKFFKKDYEFCQYIVNHEVKNMVDIEVIWKD